MRPESHCANYAWIGLAAGIVAWDVCAPETMSHAARRYMETPVGKLLWNGLVGAMALHLMDLYEPLGLPDPFKLTLERMHRETR